MAKFRLERPVLGNPVFRLVGAVDPTLNAVALAFRLADHLDGGRHTADVAKASPSKVKAMA